MSTESQGDVAQTNDDQHRVAVEQAKLMNDLRRTIDAIESMKLHVHTDMPRLLRQKNTMVIPQKITMVFWGSTVPWYSIYHGLSLIHI